MFIINKYYVWYFRIINNAKQRKLQKALYYERHHIIPRSLGGDNSYDNIATLTAREHFIVHLLLPKFLESKDHQYRLSWALARFCNKSKHAITSRQYDTIRSTLSELQRDRKHRPESILKMRECKLGNKNPSYGKPGTRLGTKSPSTSAMNVVRKSKTWIVETPAGERLTIQRLRSFCQENNLNYMRMMEVAGGRQRQHRGYKLYYLL